MEPLLVLLLFILGERLVFDVKQYRRPAHFLDRNIAGVETVRDCNHAAKREKMEDGGASDGL